VKKEPKKYKYITANSPNEIFQIDLLDYSNYSGNNRQNKWILICVDVFTRKAFAEPMKDKTAKSTEEAFKNVLKEAVPRVIFHDMGSEFKGSFYNFIHSKNIISIENEFKNHNALGIIDRFSRTIKSMIAKYLTANNTTKWVDELPRLIDIYNKTPNAGIENLKPNNIENNEENLLKISTLNFQKQMRNSNLDKKNKRKIKAGDNVRIKTEKGTFAKGYEITFSSKVYTVDNVDGTIAYISGVKYPFNKLMVVPDGTESIDTTEIDNKKKENKAKRAFNKSGLNVDNLDGVYYKK
jgi:hypothetical protein